MNPVHRLFVMLAITLILLTFLFSPVQLAINEAVEGDAQIQTQLIASAINLMLTSPSITSYMFEMPKSDCTVVITESFVRLTKKRVASEETSYTSSIIKTGTNVVGGEFRCRTNIELRRTGNDLRIIQGGQ